VSNKVGLMRTRLATFVLFASFFLLQPVLRAADAQWPAKLGEWTLNSPSARSSAGTSEASSSDALSRESGLVSVAHRTYSKGDDKAYLTLYTFHDSSGAYEWLHSATFVMKEDWHSSFEAFYRSNQVLRVESQTDLDDALKSEAAKWAQSISDRVATPPIAGYLPRQNHDVGSEVYALGPVGFGEGLKRAGRTDAAALTDKLGFESHAEAMLAKYKRGKDEATLLLIEYPTPQLAELHLRHLSRALADAKLKDSSIERKGSLLSIVLAPSSAEYAEKLRGSVNYETQVTWNEPSSTATDPPIISTLVKIIIATGVFMGATLVLGIAFGGVRVITKRLFPGKVFDRKEQIEVLQLGLGSKPIDPSDMY
jgi:hypothetical protein